MSIERTAGHITTVHGRTVYSPPLPDWSLSYISFDSADEMARLRTALIQARATIVKVTDQRIYFED